MAVPGTGTPHQASMVDTGDPRAAAWHTIQGVWRFTALYAMAELDLAGHLSAGPATPAQLAGRCGLQQSQLTRLLRALAAMGFIEIIGDSCTLTEQGSTLRADVPGSMRWPILSIGERGSWNALPDLAETVRTGRSPFVQRYGSMYGYLEQHPQAARTFDAFMAARSKDTAEALAGHRDFSDAGVIADIGSGVGIILAAVLNANPHLRGILFDRKEVEQSALEFVADRGLDDRCEFIPGDYFTAVPEGADIYLLCSIIHNHGRHDAVRALRTVRAAMHPRSRLLAIDMLLPGATQDHVSVFLDLRMMTVFNGGQERTQTEYTAVLKEADLNVTNVTPLLPTPMSLIEATPAAP